MTSTHNVIGNISYCPRAICTMTSFYFYDQNPSGFCFLLLIRAFVIQTSLGLHKNTFKLHLNLNIKLNMKGKTNGL